jgi:hypothetical protein
MSVTVTQPPLREALVEAVAAIDAAGMTLFQVLGDDHLAGQFLIDMASRFQVELLDGPTEDEWTPSDPTVVAVNARANEIEADLLEAISRDERIGLLRERAEDYRRMGTTSINFLTGEVMEWS